MRRRGGQPGRNAEAAVGQRPRGQFTTGRGGASAHAAQAVTARAVAARVVAARAVAIVRVGRAGRSVVGHGEGEGIGLIAQADLGGRAGARMAQHVGQGFLQDPVRRVVGVGGQRPRLAFHGHRHRRPGGRDRVPRSAPIPDHANPRQMVRRTTEALIATGCVRQASGLAWFGDFAVRFEPRTTG